MKTKSMSNLVKSVSHIKRYGMNSPRPLINPGNSFRCYCKRAAVESEDLKPY